MKSSHFGLWEFGAVGSIGALFGLITGLSSSPIVGGLLSGLFGILAAAATFVLGKGKESGDKPDPPGGQAAPQSKDARADSGPYSIVSKAIVLFCVTNVFFMFLGIEVRTGSVTGSLTSKPQENPIAISGLVISDKGIGSDFYLRLLLLQKMLQDSNVSVKEANAYLRFVAASGGDKWVLSEDRVREHEAFLRQHWEFMGRVRNRDAVYTASKLEDNLKKNKVPDAIWKNELTEIKLSLDRQPRDSDSEREQAALAKALFGLRNLMAPEMDVLASHLRKAKDTNGTQKPKQDNRPALAD